jgi:hypothetical protein
MQPPEALEPPSATALQKLTSAKTIESCLSFPNAVLLYHFLTLLVNKHNNILREAPPSPTASYQGVHHIGQQAIGRRFRPGIRFGHRQRPEHIAVKGDGRGGAHDRVERILAAD